VLPGDSPHPAGGRPPSLVGPQPPGIYFLLEVLEPYQASGCVGLIAQLATVAFHLGTEFACKA
jgi:hypothetical protein